MVDGLPAEVTRAGRALARLTGIDEADGLSFAAEAWWAKPDVWPGEAFRRCVDEARHRFGKRGQHHDALLGDTTTGESPLVALIGAAEDDGYARAEARCDLLRVLADLPDEDLGALARVYWLGVPFPRSGPVAVATMRAMRHARRNI
jgi:hypothetical protein